MATPRHWELSVNTLGPLTPEKAEVLVGAGFRWVYLDAEAIGDPEPVRALLDRFGLRAVSVHVPVLARTWELDEPRGVARLVDQMDRAAVLGVRCVTNHPEPSFALPDQRREQQYRRDDLRRQYVERIAGVFARGARRAAEHGITFAIENMLPHPFGGYMNTSDELIGLIHEVGEPNVGACLDTGHATLARCDPARFIRDLGTLLVETHFQDNLGRMDRIPLSTDFHRPPGVGRIDWIGVMDALDAVGYRGVVNFELGLRPGDDPAVLFRMTHDNWRAFERLRTLIPPPNL